MLCCQLKRYFSVFGVAEKVDSKFPIGLTNWGILLTVDEAPINKQKQIQSK